MSLLFSGNPLIEPNCPIYISNRKYSENTRENLKFFI